MTPSLQHLTIPPVIWQVFVEGDFRVWLGEKAAGEAPADAQTLHDSEGVRVSTGII
jgi:hypothetical protein